MWAIRIHRILLVLRNTTNHRRLQWAWYLLMAIVLMFDSQLCYRFLLCHQKNTISRKGMSTIWYEIHLCAYWPLTFRKSVRHGRKNGIPSKVPIKRQKKKDQIWLIVRTHLQYEKDGKIKSQVPRSVHFLDYFVKKGTKWVLFVGHPVFSIF